MNDKQQKPNKFRKPPKRTKNYRVEGFPMRELISEQIQNQLFKLTIKGDK